MNYCRTYTKPTKYILYLSRHYVEVEVYMSVPYSSDNAIIYQEGIEIIENTFDIKLAEHHWLSVDLMKIDLMKTYGIHKITIKEINRITNEI